MSSTGIPMNVNQPVELDNWSLDTSKFEEGVLTVLHKVRPHWSPGEVVFRYFTEGITNKLVGCFHNSAPEDVVLVRVNGEGTEHIIDREEEIKTFHLLYSASCGPPLYAIFKNGMAYGFFAGQPLDEKIVREEPVATLIAKEMVRLHSVDPDSQPVGKRQSFYRNKTQRFLDKIPDSFEDPARQARYVEKIPSRMALQSELDELVEKLEGLEMPIVFSHNDLLLKNIVYNQKQQIVRFIDYEYASLNYQAYDIGNHFCEYAGVDEVDYSLYPDKDYQMKWLRHYLEFWFLAQGRSAEEVTDLDVERLYVQANICACASHFFWGLWAMIQAKYSSISFDFFQYSITRLDEYFRCKKQFFDLTMP